MYLDSGHLSVVVEAASPLQDVILNVPTVNNQTGNGKYLYERLLAGDAPECGLRVRQRPAS